MRTHLLVASTDYSYTQHLSKVIAEEHMEVFELSICNTLESLYEQLAIKKYDIAIMDAGLMEAADLISIHLPLLLWSEIETENSIDEKIIRIRKYQRISSMMSTILELYAKSLPNLRSPEGNRAHITAFWSPVGGVGKTTAALAYCAKSAIQGKQVLYLSLEQFSSTHTYFDESGKGISSVFEMLESGEGNIEILIRSLCNFDKESGISYFSRPDNFDDMNILTAQSIIELVDACARITDELVIDMSSTCDQRTQAVFEISDKIYMVADSSYTSQVKYEQFTSQHNIFDHIRGKTVFIANKGAILSAAYMDEIISFPHVALPDPINVYKSLSGISFNEPLHEGETQVLMP
ncbi:MAG: hypothetical protein FWG88_10515 [Oscillospiraceae bacterium]|nr:hypothetical protein [Oscillospiraceae bacterium]